MKKIIYILYFLTYASILSAQITGKIDVQSPDIEFFGDAVTQKIIWNKSNCFTEEVGYPQLPVLVESFVVPFDAKVMNITVSSLIKQRMNGNYNLYLVEDKIPIGIKEAHPITQTSEKYDENNPYPLKKAEIISDTYEYGYHVITVRFYPFEYIESSKSIFMCSFSYSINYTREHMSYESPLKLSSYRAELSYKLMQSKVRNINDVEIFSNLNLLKVNVESTDMNKNDGTDNQMQRSFSIIEEQIPEYFIVTNNLLKPSFQKLADWKTKKGIPAIVKTIEEIDTNYSGGDLAEKIRNYLKECKRKWGDGFFVLLGGDTNIIPARMATNGANRYRNPYHDIDSVQTPQDLYYTALNGNWNINNNHVFNEYAKIGKEANGKNIIVNVDSASFGKNLYLGRASVENIKEADVFVNKVLTYEKANADIDYSYLNNSVAADAYIDQDATGHLSLGGMTPIDSYYKNKAPKLNKWLIFDHFLCECNKHFYNKIDSTGEELNKNNFMSALQNGGNSGLNHFHLVYHSDHSIATSMGTSSLDKGESIGNDDVDILTNGKYYQIVISSGCSPATYTYDCIGEHFINNANGGAVAFIGNADVGWSNEYYQFGNFLDAIYSKTAQRFDLGYAFQAAIGNNDPSNCRLHLLGDPEMPVWTEIPKDLQVDVFSAPIITGENYINVRVNNLPSGQEAVICMMKGNEGYARKTVTSKDPQVRFRFVPHTSGKIDVTVTSHNFRPYETTIPVELNESNAVTISDLIFNDDNSNGSNGDGNHQPDAGETIELTVKLKNSGKLPVYGMWGNLSCNSPYITIPYRDSEVGNIAPEGNAIVKFFFKIDKNAPEILKNDLNAVRFRLNLTDAANVSYPDTFRIDLFAPKLELREQTVTPIWGESNTYQLKVNLMNTGKAQANGLKASILPISDGIIGCPVNSSSYPILNPNETGSNNTNFSYRLNGMNNPDNVRFKIIVKNFYGKEWTFDFNPKDRCDAIKQSGLKFKSYVDAIDIFWEPIAGASGYDIYRSANGVNGTYVKQNLFPLTASYYTDTHIERLKTYNYKVTALSASGNQSDRSGAIKAWTTWPLIGMFPRFTSESSLISGSVNTADVDFDGKKEIFVTELLWNTNNDGYLLGLRHDGEELFDIDGNVTSFSGFAKLSTSTLASPAIGDLKGDGEQNIITATWKRVKEIEGRNSIECFASRDSDGDRKPDQLWKYDMDSIRSYRGVVLSNIDNSPDGTMEVIYRSITADWILIIDCNGKLKTRIPITAGNHTMLAVADLDGDGDKEILASAGTTLNIWHHNGTPFKTNPFFDCWKNLSSPVICDLNNDGKKEILIAEKETLESKIYAIDLNGNCLPGWDGSANAASIPYTLNSLDHSISVGDINKDGKLEVVSLGHNVVRAWKNDGTLIFSREIKELFSDVEFAANYITPVLADVDGKADNYMPDIVFGSDIGVFALHNDGTDVIGFPILTDYKIDGSVFVADLDNDGKNELVAADGNIYAWRTDGSPAAIEWASERHDPQNTGEYGKICEPRLILSSQTWNGVDPCGNVIVERGTLTIPSGKTLSLTDKTSKIIVRPGASLVVDGGTISNAYVRALPGGRVLLKNGGKISLRYGGKMTIDNGATLSNQGGRIE